MSSRQAAVFCPAISTLVTVAHVHVSLFRSWTGQSVGLVRWHTATTNTYLHWMNMRIHLHISLHFFIFYGICLRLLKKIPLYPYCLNILHADLKMDFDNILRTPKFTFLNNLKQHRTWKIQICVAVLFLCGFSGVLRVGVCLLLWVPPWWFTAHGLHGLNSLPAHEHAEEESHIAGGSAITPGARVRTWQGQLVLEIRAYGSITTSQIPHQYKHQL